MNQNAVNYLQQNKDKYTKEQLIDQLKKAGYSYVDINESVTNVYAEKVNFWNFKIKKIYQNRNEKIIDFVVGFFGLSIINIILNSISFGLAAIIGIKEVLYFLLPIELFVYLVLLVYLYKRRRFILYGMLIPFIMYVLGTLFLLALGLYSPRFF